MGWAKIFLIVVNVIFFILGVGILVPGVLFLLDVTFVTDEIKPVADSVSVSGITLSGLLSDLAIVFVCLGTFVTLISILGVIGAACTNKIILIVYVVIVMILALAQIVSVILYIILKDEIDNELKTSLTDSLKTNYKYDALDSVDTLSNSFNYLFLTYKCCSFNDISSITNDFDTTPWCTDATINERCYRGNGEIPRACCDGVTSDTYTSQPSSCTLSLTNYYTQGCYDKLKSDFGNLTTGAIVVGVLAIVVQVLAVIAGICLCKDVSNKVG